MNSEKCNVLLGLMLVTILLYIWYYLVFSKSTLYQKPCFKKKILFVALQKYNLKNQVFSPPPCAWSPFFLYSGCRKQSWVLPILASQPLGMEYMGGGKSVHEMHHYTKMKQSNRKNSTWISMKHNCAHFCSHVLWRSLLMQNYNGKETTTAALHSSYQESWFLITVNWVKV